VHDKTPEIYRAILARYQIAPQRFLMVGNSLRSDVLPVLEAGGRAVYIPYANTWVHEHVEAPAEGFATLENLRLLPGYIERLAQDA
jgi:putative hydrolase of the HAD superfamily